jgi:hypothetical protein
MDPASDVTFHQFVARVDGEGASPSRKAMTLPAPPCGMSLSSPHSLSTRIYPVLDIAEAAGLLTEGAEWRKSIT